MASQNSSTFITTYKRLAMLQKLTATFLLGITTLASGSGHSAELNNAELRGAIRDQTTGFYLDEADDLGLRWVVVCENLPSDVIHEWSECTPLYPLDPILYDVSTKQLVVEQIAAQAMLDGELSVPEMYAQIDEMLLVVAAQDELIEMGKKMAITGGSVIVGQVIVSRALDAVDVNSLAYHQKKFWLHGITGPDGHLILRQNPVARRLYRLQNLRIGRMIKIDLLSPLKNMHTRFFLSLISKTALARAAAASAAGLGIVVATRSIWEQDQLVGKQAFEESVTIQQLLEAFTHESSEVIYVRDAITAMDSLMSGLDESAGAAVLYRLQKELSLIDTDEAREEREGEGENQKPAAVDEAL